MTLKSKMLINRKQLVWNVGFFNYFLVFWLVWFGQAPVHLLHEDLPQRQHDEEEVHRALRGNGESNRSPAQIIYKGSCQLKKKMPTYGNFNPSFNDIAAGPAYYVLHPQKGIYICVFLNYHAFKNKNREGIVS